MEDVYFLIVHGPPVSGYPDGNTAIRGDLFTDLDAYLSQQDMGDFTVMAGKRNNPGDVPNQFKPLKKIRRRPKPAPVDPMTTEEIT